MTEPRLIAHTDVEAQHPWPEDCFIQGGGRGVVFVKDGDNYRTAFVEAFPDTFIRGEGATIQEAEDAAWATYQRQLDCAGPDGHEYEPRNYKNGAGFCKRCGKFKSKVFTPEDLGLSCKVCSVPTYWSRRGDDFYCPDHEDDAKEDPRSTGSVLGDMFRVLGDD